MTPPVHYEAAPGRLTLYIAGQPARVTRKDYQIIALARQAINGRLIVPADPEPIEITDHAWLLRFAAAAAAVAAEMVEASRD